MKCKKFINIILGIFITIGPFTLFRVCDFSKRIMKCTYSATCISILGIMIIVISIIQMRKKTSLLLDVVILCLYALSIAIPRFIIGGCNNIDMRCNSITFSTVYLLAVVGIIINFIDLIIKKRKDK